jgi:hypothetical protein
MDARGRAAGAAALIGENAVIAVVDRRLAAVAASVGPDVR